MTLSRVLSSAIMGIIMLAIGFYLGKRSQNEAEGKKDGT